MTLFSLQLQRVHMAWNTGVGALLVTEGTDSKGDAWQCWCCITSQPVTKLTSLSWRYTITLQKRHKPAFTMALQLGQQPQGYCHCEA